MNTKIYRDAGIALIVLGAIFLGFPNWVRSLIFSGRLWNAWDTFDAMGIGIVMLAVGAGLEILAWSRKDEPPAGIHERCPHCREWVSREAKLCWNCGKEV
jgi:hypothetical protein